MDRRSHRSASKDVVGYVKGFDHREFKSPVPYRILEPCQIVSRAILYLLCVYLDVFTSNLHVTTVSVWLAKDLGMQRVLWLWPLTFITLLIGWCRV